MLSNVLTELKCHPVKVRNLKPIQIRLWLIIERWIITHQRMKIKTYPNSSPFLVYSRIGISSRMIGNIAYIHGHNQCQAEKSWTECIKSQHCLAWNLKLQVIWKFMKLWRFSTVFLYLQLWFDENNCEIQKRLVCYIFDKKYCEN